MQMSKNITKYILALVSIIVLFSSCKKEYESIQSIDEAKIKAYIQKNNIPAVRDESGFYYQILEQGTGGPLLNKDSVLYTSTVTSLTGTSYYSPIAFSNDGTYLGYVTPEPYRIAMLNINRGGKIRVIIPSHLAFGKNGEGNIPPNEIIVSELTVFPEKSQIEVDDNRIKAFLTAKALTGFTKHPSRVYIKQSVVGTGTAIDASSTIVVKYKGRLLTGTIFDESGATDLERPLAELIGGWQKILVGVTKGTTLRIFIPSDLGYGITGNGSVPGNAVLDFDIEVVDVK
jgi:FKBP-type peptidyl-prolyl cis-trans isomerase